VRGSAAGAGVHCMTFITFLIRDLEEATQLVHAALYRRYGDIEVLPAQGMLRGQCIRLQIKRKPIRCIIRYAPPKCEGRYLFTYSPSEGSFVGLSNDDLVALVGSTTSSCRDLRLSVYKQAALLEAFSSKREAMRGPDSERRSVWFTQSMNEDRDSGEQVTSLGEALWTECLRWR
jgi:hypothetical protein